MRLRLRTPLNWRWTRARSCALGGAITLLVVLLDSAHAFRSLEYNLYDWRALNFQYFTPPPTDRIVHLDIDDASLETIGRWPWPRSTQAEVVDEVRMAGADVLALDIIFAEPQESTTTLVNGSPVTVDHDAELAAAFKRFGKVLVPVSLGELVIPSDRPAAEEVKIARLRSDPEMDEQAFIATLPAKRDKSQDSDVFVRARRAALSDRIRAELDANVQFTDVELRKQILPGTGASADDPSLLRQFQAQLLQARSVSEERRFTLTRSASQPPLMTGTEHQLIAPFARVAGFSGFVDDIASEDGRIRGVPLWIEYDGRIYPQFDLAVACAALHADLRGAVVEPDRVTVPVSGGRQMEIPVRTRRGRNAAGAPVVVGAYYDIPWFGTERSKMMFDFRRWIDPKQHVPVTLAWALAQSRPIVIANNAKAIGPIRAMAEADFFQAKKFCDGPPPDRDDIAGWLARVGPVAKEAAEVLADRDKDATAQFTPHELALFDACTAVRDAARESQALLDKSRYLKQVLGGRVVLIGSTATSALDVRPTPLDPQCPGVFVHGATTHALMTAAAWRYAPAWVTPLITIVVGLFVTFTVAWVPPWKAMLGTLLIAGAYVLLNGYVFFDYGDWIVGLAGPLVAATVVWGILTVVRFVIERAERARITKKFRGYVDPQVVEYFIEHPEIERFEGQVREVTVCFTDLAGFTTMTERLREKAVPILGRYINRMVKVMRRHRGLMNRLMGDGIMFSYGAPKDNPNHAADAVTTVLEMQEEMVLLNRELAEEGLPQLAVRGGVSTGTAVVGDSGGADASDFTCLGDTTNFGARLESANKYTGTKNLISARTVELLGGKFLVRPVALLQVAGKTQSVMTYEPLAHAAAATDEQRKVAAMTQAMFDHYQAAQFKECVTAADALEVAFGPFKLAKLYRDTCNRYIAAGKPPDGFKGEIVLTEK